MKVLKFVLWAAMVAVAASLTVSLSAQTNCNEGAGPLKDGQPQGISAADIIKKFSAQESEFRDAETHYNYRMEILVQTLAGATPDGEYRKISRISYSQGKRQETPEFSPQSTLQRVAMTKQDFDDINRSPFVLTTEDLPEYDLKYAGQQKVDTLDTYVFDVSPKQMEKGKRYFQGRVWVENRDLALVKSCGKGVPEEDPEKKKKKKGSREENVAPTFVTYREQFEHRYWFPVYVRSDEELHFQLGEPVHVREVIKFTEYKRDEANAATAGTGHP